jgi:hypothetical protein
VIRVLFNYALAATQRYISSKRVREILRFINWKVFEWKWSWFTCRCDIGSFLKTLRNSRDTGLPTSVGIAGIPAEARTSRIPTEWKSDGLSPQFTCPAFPPHVILKLH